MIFRLGGGEGGDLSYMGRVGGDRRNVCAPPMQSVEAKGSTYPQCFVYFHCFLR